MTMAQSRSARRLRYEASSGSEIVDVSHQFEMRVQAPLDNATAGRGFSKQYFHDSRQSDAQ